MQKTMLKIVVEYDEKVTDPEALAAAFDNLLETALCVVSVDEDEYGRIRLGEFFVDETPEPGAAAFAEMEAIADEDDG